MSNSVKNKEIGKNARIGLGPDTQTVSTRKKKLPPARKLVYDTLKSNGVSRRTARDIAGYRHDPSSTGTIDQQREKALIALNLSIYSQLNTLKDIRDDTQRSCPSDRIHAVKTINSMVPGWQAPGEIKVSATSVFVEFKDISSAQLAELADLLDVNASGYNVGLIEGEYSEVIDNE